MRWALGAVLALAAVLALLPRVQVVVLAVQADEGVRAALADWLHRHALGHALWQAYPARLRRGLAQAFPALSDLRVRWVLVGRLVISARTRKAFALARADGRWWFVDAEGSWPGDARADLPILRAPRARWREGAALAAVLATQAPQKWQVLSELRFVTGWRLVFAKGELWLVGGVKPVARLREVLGWMKRTGLRAPVRLDATMPERWFVRPARLVEVEG